MSEYPFEHRASLDTRQIVDDIAKRIQDEVDHAALDKAADTLAKFGYEKVVRCRDCKYHNVRLCERSACWLCGEPQDVKPDDYCSRGERREQ